jgi:hypothetical protein
MTAEELVKQYKIVRAGDKIRISNPQSLSEDVKAELVAAKPEIMAYLLEREKKQQEEYQAMIQREKDFLDSVPGLREIEAGQTQWAKYKEAFDAAWENGDGVYPQAPFEAGYLDGLRAQYPDAVWVLKVRHESIYSANFELQAIAERVYEKLQGGTGIEEAKAEYDSAHKAFVARHIWD